jgi:cytoskeletal protein RodZ
MASHIGPTLRKARTEKGIELSEVERVTKIRQRFLSAMEADRWEELPAPVYARSFLSTYARYLGLEEEPLLERYAETFGEHDPRSSVPRGAVHAGEIGRARSARPRGILRWLGVIAGVLLVGLVIAAVVGGSSGGGGGEKQARKAPAHAHAGATTTGTTSSTGTATSTTTATTTTATSSEVSVELRSTADVWVCLVDSRGRAVVNSETLTADQTRGPFTGKGFEMTFGNGSVELTVDGQPVKVPSLAQPLGYRVSPSGAQRLKPSSQPSCV